MKRVNFNMEDDCHALLKSVCALKGVTVSDYVYNLIARSFEQLVRNDDQVRQMFLNGNYSDECRAQVLKEKLINEYESDDE